VAIRRLPPALMSSVTSGWLAVCGLAVFLVFCLVMVRPRFICQQGIREFKIGRHDQAIAFFEKAESVMPAFFTRTLLTAVDRFNLYTYFGRALYHAGKEGWKQNGLTLEVYALMVRSRDHLEQAAAIEQGYYMTTYWRARTEHALERVHPWLFPGTPNPYNADTLYLQASTLRPAGITVRQAHARYLHDTGQQDQIPPLVKTLLEIYPASYGILKKEPYFTPGLLPYMVQGLETAVEKRVQPRSALQSLSRLYQDQGNLTAAIDIYETYLAHNPEANTSGDFFLLGELCLQDGRYEKSHDPFVRSITAAEDPEGAINRIYTLFRIQNQLTRFLTFIEYLKGTGMGVPGIDMVLVRCYLDMDQVFLATELLRQIIENRPTGPACVLMATIARNENDWDAMEVYSHLATRLDTYNHSYHYLFAQALNLQKKYVDAEYAVTSAIRYAPKENPGYFDFRAWTRWHQKKFSEAAMDWEKAFQLSPDRSDFPFRAALAYERIGRREKARDLAARALALAPDDKAVQDLHFRLNI
jgi:tetratricopeptide (TPR) repeat protein